MADTTVFWNSDSEEDRKRFALLLAPLVGASRTKTFTRHEGTAYLLSMQDVSPAILEEAVVVLVRRGITWMPKPGDLKAECVRILNEKRAAARLEQMKTCQHISGGWREVIVNGVERMERCECWTAGKAAADRIGAALELPPVSYDEADLS